MWQLYGMGTWHDQSDDAHGCVAYTATSQNCPAASENGRADENFLRVQYLVVRKLTRQNLDPENSRMD